MMPNRASAYPKGGGLGPHLGQGFGGKWVLTGDLEADRAAVEETLEQLLTQTKRGDFDNMLAVLPTPS